MRKAPLTTIVQAAQAPGSILAPRAAGTCLTLEEGQLYPCVEITRVAPVEVESREYQGDTASREYMLIQSCWNLSMSVSPPRSRK